MFESSYIELDYSKLASNRKFIKSLCGSHSKISTVVKGNAYGHGIPEFVVLAEKTGADHFSVYSADEAYEVFHAAVNNPEIHIMGNLDHHAVDWAVMNNICFYVSDSGRLNHAIESARSQHKKARIHLELETGMNRTGMNATILEESLIKINRHKDLIHLMGTCTHFAGAESAVNYDRIESQMTTFNELLRIFQANSTDPGIIHTSCSAGMINFPQYNHHMVRIGIMNYGFWPNMETKKKYMKKNSLAVSPLKRIISWKSHIMSVKYLEKGCYVGYGNSFRAENPMTIAIIPVGYAHGYSRTLSNRGHVLIRGMKAPVVGIVNMNCIAADISKTPASEPGDEVVLIGRQGNHEITINSFSESLHVLNYEFLTRLPRNIPRIITRNGIPDTQ